MSNDVSAHLVKPLGFLEVSTGAIIAKIKLMTAFASDFERCSRFRLLCDRNLEEQRIACKQCQNYQR